jgi:hypothetical protein
MLAARVWEKLNSKMRNSNKIRETLVCVRRGVDKKVEHGRSPPVLWAGTPETAVRPFQGWPAHRA